MINNILLWVGIVGTGILYLFIGASLIKWANNRERDVYGDMDGIFHELRGFGITGIDDSVFKLIVLVLWPVAIPFICIIDIFRSMVYFILNIFD